MVYLIKHGCHTYNGVTLLHGALLYMVTNIELTLLFIIFLSKTVLPPKRYAMLIMPCTVDVCTLPVANREHYSRAFTSALIAEKRNHRGKKKTQYAELKALNNCDPLTYSNEKSGIE